MRSVKEALEQRGHIVRVPMGTEEEVPIEAKPGISKDELIAFQEKAIVSYYIRPKLIFRHLLRSFKCY